MLQGASQPSLAPVSRVSRTSALTLLFSTPRHFMLFSLWGQVSKSSGFPVIPEAPLVFSVRPLLTYGSLSIAIMSGKEESEESIKHRWMAIKTVNERLSKRSAASDDSNIASVALLAGLEVFIIPSCWKRERLTGTAHVRVSAKL